jgi:hypothetical protein
MEMKLEKTCNKNNVKKNLKGRFLFFRKLIVNTDYKDGRHKIDKMCNFKAKSIVTQCNHIHFPEVFLLWLISTITI